MLSGIADRLMRRATRPTVFQWPGRSWWAILGVVLTVGVAVCTGPAHAAPAETVAPLLQQAMPNLPGKTLTAISVVFPPGAKALPHRHGNAFLYAYVLQGSVRSQIEGQAARVYRTGESWTEKPGDHHVLTENVSSSETARLLVVFVADSGASLKSDDAS